MRLAKLGYFLLSGLAIILAQSFSAYAGNAFVLKIKGDTYDLRITHQYDKRVSFDEVVRTIEDHSIFPEISNLITRAEISPLSGEEYLLSSTATRKLDVGLTVSATTGARCTKKLDRNQFIERCTMDISTADTGKYFKSGRNDTYCKLLDNHQTTCTYVISGQPKPIRVWPVFSRTSQQLACAGVAESMHDYGVLFRLINNKTTSQSAKKSYNGSAEDAFRQKLFSDCRTKVDSNQYKAQTLIIEGHDSQNQLSIRAE